MVSIDVRGNYLHECLIAKHQPRLVFMNTDEFSEAGKSWKELSQREFPGTLIVHDKDGCRIWDRRLPDAHDLFSETQYFPSPKVDRIYSTIGAGDAMHAGFLKEWIFSKSENDRLQRSVIFSQAVAAMSVSNEKATHGIDAKIIKK
jgi:fructose-1-phosphate kinase PfkB-like protein